MKTKTIVFIVTITITLLALATFAVNNYPSNPEIFEAPIIEERSNSEKLTSTLLVTMEALKVARGDLAKAQSVRIQAELIEEDYKELESLAYADYLKVVEAIEFCEAVNCY